MQPFKIVRSTSGPVPIVLSVPHCGVAFPPELANQYNQVLMQRPDDTDWFVDELYGFAADMGITMISAVYSRWVIDLNRHPESKPLYTDGRMITGLCPTTDFLGSDLYADHRSELHADDVRSRLENFYWPYHHALQAELAALKDKFGSVLLWDCHSIRQVVPTIQKEKFPDLILGDADRTAASPGVIETVLKILESSGYSCTHNHPFKGGYITRQYGRPTENVHSLQLEMSKVNYMNDSENAYDDARAQKMQRILQSALGTLIDRFFN